jgi:hypothetical protein
MKQKMVFFLLIGCAVIIFSGLGSADALDWDNPWPPSSPFPKFVLKDYLPLSEIESITKFRSGVGHDYSDQYESNRSMKHYYAPKPQYREGNGTNHDLKLYSPINGTIAEIKPESRILSNGQVQGYQVHITPDNYPMFDVILFHVNCLDGISVGVHVAAGQWLGYADMRESYTSDIAVACIYGAPPVYNWGGPSDRGFKYLSVFQVMADALFAQYQERGVATRTQPIITKEYRDTHPITNWQTYNPDDWVVLQPPKPKAATVPETMLLLGQ